MRYGDWYFRVNKNDNNIIIENNVKQLLYTESFKTDTDCNAIYSVVQHIKRCFILHNKWYYYDIDRG